MYWAFRTEETSPWCSWKQGLTARDRRKIVAFESVNMGHSKAPHTTPPTRSRLEALCSDVVQQLEQLQFTNLRKTARQYFQSTEVKGWIRFNRRKSTKTKHSTPRTDAKVQERLKQPHKPPNLPKHNRHSLSLHSVNSECQAFPKYWNQNMGSRSERNQLNRSKQQERASEVAVKPSCISAAESATSSHMKVERLGNEPRNSRRFELPSRVYQSSSEIGYVPHKPSCQISSPMPIPFKYRPPNEFYKNSY